MHKRRNTFLSLAWFHNFFILLIFENNAVLYMKKKYKDPLKTLLLFLLLCYTGPLSFFVYACWLFLVYIGNQTVYVELVSTMHRKQFFNLFQLSLHITKDYSKSCFINCTVNCKTRRLHIREANRASIRDIIE